MPDVFYRFYHRSEKNACPDLNGLCPRPSIYYVCPCNVPMTHQYHPIMVILPFSAENLNSNSRVFFTLYTRIGKGAVLLVILLIIHSKQPILGLTQEWLISVLGVHDRLHIYPRSGIFYIPWHRPDVRDQRLIGKLMLHDVLRHLPQVIESYDCRSKFDSVLHTDNDDVLHGFSASNVEFRGLSTSRARRLK